MIVKRDKGQIGFYGCTNYSPDGAGCNNTIPFANPRSNNTINDIYLGENGTFWIGTLGGVSLYMPKA